MAVVTQAVSRTVSHPVCVSGIGIHTGKPSVVTVHPASPGAGIVFRREATDILARPEQVVDTARCTVLGRDGITVSTVEHLMSAFAGLGISDALVEVEGPELPIGDGAAKFWVDAIKDAWVSDGMLSPNPSVASISAPLIVTGKGGSFIAAYPADSLRLTVAISFEHPLVGTQVARFEPASEDYAEQVAPARTFGFIEEVEALLAAGLAQGGSLENAVIVYPDRYSVPLRFANELARHKLLDLLGDLWLAGAKNCPTADIIAVKPSHRLNVAFATELVARQLADVDRTV